MCYKQKCKVVSLNLAHPVCWNSSKIISHLVSSESSLSTEPNIMDRLQGNTPNILSGIGVGYGRSSLWHAKALVSVKCDKIALRLLLRSNRKSYTHFRLVPNSTTLDDLHGSLCSLFQNACVMCCYLFIFSFTFSVILVDK